eukprot:TRINITY_DN4472_c0_g2_i1.p1 TRINITY_DN4472_c0_g2~~TRINITY_DN4472_c0_g2_i1.p1  ORF type:complete len:287 (+),score=46.99 TRINITY_DN4472_c0_g2_i1:72-932(+)
MADDFEVRVVSVTGESIGSYTAHGTDSVAELKRQISVTANIPAASLQLLFRNDILANETTLGALDLSSCEVTLIRDCSWKLLTRHTHSYHFFDMAGICTKNADNPEALLFADLEIDYDPFRDNMGRLVFKMVWPSLVEDTGDERLEQNYIAWSQSSTPLERICGYEPLSVPYPGPRDEAFGGVAPSLVYGEFRHYQYSSLKPETWWKGIRGPIANGRQYVVQQVELWIARDPCSAADELVGQDGDVCPTMQHVGAARDELAGQATIQQVGATQKFARNAEFCCVTF